MREPPNAARDRLLHLGAALLLAAVLSALSYLLFSAPAAPQVALTLVRAEMGDLPGWAEDDPAPALAAFRRSCEDVLTGDPGAAMGGAGYAGTRGDWRGVCLEAAALAEPTAAAARVFFAERFVPVAIGDAGRVTGLMTGYYEPELAGSLTRRTPQQTPLWGRPRDLVSVDLGLFRDTDRGERLAGRVVEGALMPYPERSAIVRDGLAGVAEPVAFADDAIDAFFLEIQGSGRLRLPDGTIVRLGYAAQNGRPYTAIGRTLIAKGALAREQVSMQSIRAWLKGHPHEAQAVMDTNPSYVFFQLLDVADPALGAIGAEGVQITPGRTLAVDRRFHPLGVPMWLATDLPAPQAGAPDRPVRRLMVAQDTGGAIRGPVRADIYLGFDAEAAEIAARTRHDGRLWVLLPRAVAERLP